MELKPPYLISAFFCEKVLIEQDGVSSAIRIVDRIFVRELAKKTELASASFYALTIVLMFKSGGYKGPAKIQVSAIRPSGEIGRTLEQEVIFPEQANAGANFVATVPFGPSEEGVYWFDVSLNGRLITRTPLEAQLLPAQLSPSATESPKPPRGKK